MVFAHVASTQDDNKSTFLVESAQLRPTPHRFALFPMCRRAGIGLVTEVIWSRGSAHDAGLPSGVAAWALAISPTRIDPHTEHLPLRTETPTATTLT